MKKVKKLTLKKEVISVLNDGTLSEIKGGSDWFCNTNLYTCDDRLCIPCTLLCQDTCEITCGTTFNTEDMEICRYTM
jgi:hypothetical protein